MPTTGMLFSAWQATTQALQPMQVLRLMTMPQALPVPGLANRLDEGLLEQGHLFRHAFAAGAGLGLDALLLGLVSAAVVALSEVRGAPDSGRVSATRIRSRPSMTKWCWVVASG